MAKKRKKSRERKKPTKSPSSLNTKKLSAYTPTFKLVRRKSRHRELAQELYQSKHKKISSSEAIVEGISMWPSLLPGYRVSFVPIESDAVCLGDIVIIDGEDRKGSPLLRVHRIIGRVGPLFLEAGDNTFTATLIRADQILGIVTNARSAAGKPVKLKRFSEKELALRFKFWSLAAHSFMFVHEMKDRIFGNRKSPLLWQASVMYRKSFAALGLKVPTLFPSKT